MQGARRVAGRNRLSAGSFESETAQMACAGRESQVSRRRAVVVRDAGIAVRAGDRDVGSGGGNDVPVGIDRVHGNGIGDRCAGGLCGRGAGLAGDCARRRRFTRQQNLKFGHYAEIDRNRRARVSSLRIVSNVAGGNGRTAGGFQRHAESFRPGTQRGISG